MLHLDKKGNFSENAYCLTEEPLHSALLTTGNGYMGIRGSLEEFGSTRIQGAYIRGVFDEIVEVMEPFPDNVYMKKYYFDEQALKEFEKQDSCINFADILLVRFVVGAYTFYPWEGKILSWKRTLDVKRAVLIREVRWEDPDGNRTLFRFERFASYADEHLYVQRCTATPLNHTKRIRIVAGLDLTVRTGGQRITEELTRTVDGSDLKYSLRTGKKYGFEVHLAIHCDWIGEPESLTPAEDRGIVAVAGDFSGQGTVGVVKTCRIQTTRDPEFCTERSDSALENVAGKSFDRLLAEHLSVWEPLFAKYDIRIEGDKEIDASLRFSTYHTVISAERSDSVHSLSAKSLSGERYNQFVWWDAEIYQQPIFRFADPVVVRHNLDYRYRQLPDARARAEREGRKGARFPFVASVDGKEKVWKYARHPHLQEHITADVGLSILEYYEQTGDEEFLRRQGYEMLGEILRYWVSRGTPCGERYEIRNVTGTDEHHPYVNNDAYTNYLVHHVFERALALFTQDSFADRFVSQEERREMQDFCNRLYLPLEPNGMIPQFDGYFSLSRSLRTAGGGTGKNFQMKQSGLYHESQIIKQPDVMLLFSYLNLSPIGANYALNWDYYESMCESSSSLSYAPHAICSADQGRMLSFLNYFRKTVRVDLDDEFQCAWQGIHAGCAAGGYYGILRGLFGIVVTEEGLCFNPIEMPFWKSVTLSFEYRGRKLRCRLIGKKMSAERLTGEPFEIYVYGKKMRLNGRLTVLVKTRREGNER